VLSNILLFILYKIHQGGIIMVDLYVALIIRGRRTFEQVPSNLQPAVEEELFALGLGTDGKPLVV
jgi:hypothetical protein